MTPPDLADVLRDAHIFDAAPSPRGRKPILGREVWWAYCSCGWRSRLAAQSVETAAVDHRVHRASVLRPKRWWT